MLDGRRWVTRSTCEDREPTFFLDFFFFAFLDFFFFAFLELFFFELSVLVP